MARAESDVGREVGRHTVPVIETMIAIVQLMAERGRAVTISDLVADLALPRSTVYRIVNTLLVHDWIATGTRRGDFRLGHGLTRIAAGAGADPLLTDLPERARPAMEKAAAETGETVKLSVLRGAQVLVIGAVLGRNDSALITHVGTTTPLTLGASAKVLLSGMSQEDLRQKLDGMPNASILSDLDEIAAKGWARDDGEYDRSTGAHAAPIRDSMGRVVAALSILYLRSKAELFGDRFRESAMAAAESVSANMVDAEQPQR